MLFTALLFSLLTAANSTPLDSVRESFKGRAGFQVQFEQQTKQELFPEDLGLAKGEITYQRPGNLRWVYKTPDYKEIVFEKETAYILRLQGGKKEREEIPEARALGVEESFSFLWGEADLAKFKVKVLSKSSVELQPLQKDRAQFESMTIDVKNSKIQKVVVKDLLGGESQIRFKEWKFR